MSSQTTFESLGLSSPTLAALARAGFVNPTPIQAGAIPPALAGRDVIGCAATGTGKTAAFLLPIIERLAGRSGTRALVLAPTRELAAQIAEQMQLFGAGRRVRGALVIGGVGMEPQVREMRAGHEVIVATPGRLVDHLDQGTAKLDGVEVLVLDEADRMLDMGFKPQLERILKRVPKARQTMLFSATMAGEVATFAKAHLKDPARVEISRSGTIAERADQQVFLVPRHEKTAMLMALLERDELSTLIFTRTRRRADRLFKVMQRAGLKVTRLHADRTQGQRKQALKGFKDGEYRVLVATDIAARGIDVEEIGHVVNYDMPAVAEDYVHRVGRTARASAAGLASSLCSPEERPMLAEIERLTRNEVRRADVPRDSAAFQAAVERSRDGQADPGPKQAGHGVSQRAAGQPLGRHARTHPKRPRPEQAADAQRAHGKAPERSASSQPFDKRQRSEPSPRFERRDRPERAARPERPQRSERFEGAQRRDGAERGGQPRPERTERAEHAQRRDRPERAATTGGARQFRGRPGRR